MAAGQLAELGDRLSARLLAFLAQGPSLPRRARAAAARSKRGGSHE
jgi:hypothetical protein